MMPALFPNADDIPVADIPATLIELAAFQIALAVRLLDAPAEDEADPCELLRAADVARLLSVPKSAVYEACRRGQLNCVRVAAGTNGLGRTVRFSRQQVVDFVARHTEHGR